MVIRFHRYSFSICTSIDCLWLDDLKSDLLSSMFVFPKELILSSVLSIWSRCYMWLCHYSLPIYSVSWSQHVSVHEFWLTCLYLSNALSYLYWFLFFKSSNFSPECICLSFSIEYLFLLCFFDIQKLWCPFLIFILYLNYFSVVLLYKSYILTFYILISHSFIPGEKEIAHCRIYLMLICDNFKFHYE